MKLAQYLARHTVASPWRIDEKPDHLYEGAVLIPARAELSTLPLTLESISSNPAGQLRRFLILVVINNRQDASDEEKSENQETLRMMPFWKKRYRLENLQWVDAASPGKELPHNQGVGLARKTGMDMALTCLDHSTGDHPLVCLDADTLVQADYLAAIIAHFSTATAGGAVIPYKHQKAADPKGQAAIDRYELFLRSYILGLKLARSPYSFHTVGSAMACRTSAYLAAGGMNRRLAGEDFYFLQQLKKVSGVAAIAGTMVHPSPRSSHRVPFGTGRAVGDMLSDNGKFLMFYRPELFQILGEWLSCAENSSMAVGEELLKLAEQISPKLAEYLHQAGFVVARNNMLRNCKTEAQMTTAFHAWFDAFRTMRFIHHATDNGFPRMEPEDAVSPLMERVGYTGPRIITEMLEWLRSH